MLCLGHDLVGRDTNKGTQRPAAFLVLTQLPGVPRTCQVRAVQAVSLLLPHCTRHLAAASVASELQTQWVQWLAKLHAGLQLGEVVGDHSSTLQNLPATLS